MLTKPVSCKKNIDLLCEYCKDINKWPQKWEIDTRDIKIGLAINEQFKSFLIEQINKGKSKKTIKTYAHYLWALGGELIRQINYCDEERKLPARNLMLKYINETGGPYWRHASSEADHAKYDSVCKRLFKYMTGNFD